MHTQPKTKCCGPNGPVPLTGPLPEISVADSAKFFTYSMKQWLEAGAPVVNHATHMERFDKCKPCEFYSGGWCMKCRCVAYAKAKLATEKCPDSPPRWLQSL